MDTRTPRTPTGGGAPGFDERVMTMARVPSDPAQVIVNHASFRVQLGAASGRALGLDATARMPGVPSPAAGGKRRPAPLVWSGPTDPDDTLAGRLMRAVHQAGSPEAGGATQVLPRVGSGSGAAAEAGETTVLPTIVGQRSAGSSTGLLGGVRPGRGAYDPLDERAGADWRGGDGYHGDGYRDERYRDDRYQDDPYRDDRDDRDDRDAENRKPRDRRESAKHAWYPDRRLNLGIVLLPLRVFLGLISVYAGMGKLCDRVYFDGGKRGSMVTWLSSLHPWALAEPLRDAALNHPVGAGLSIAFLQVVVGVLTVCGLWQRVAGVFGAALSAALLVTVSWRTVPVYDAPDFIYLAAWSPLIIAGAPVYSIDAHLAGDAWRRLGPRASLWDLRRRVLRRGAILAAVIAGSTLLIGSVLGAAVRATTPRDERPGPGVTPTNSLPGAPLPETSGEPGATSGASPSPSRSAAAKKAKEKAKAQQKQQATATPSTAPTGHATSRTGGTSGTGGGASGAPSHSGATSGSGSAGSGTGSASGSSGGGGSQAPQTAPPPTAAAPAPPPPTAKPPTGAIGGLLGSHSPTGLLLGMEHRGSAAHGRKDLA
ncbi:DoxX family membrane protein [Streptomyces sp. SID4948]|nr:DoxX family membrane protein [Streptomyces sp. SID4948]